MPVKLGSKLPPPAAEARIEIIPLIDIMFFLLAAFMLVSLSLVNLQSVPVHLPAAATATAEAQRDFVNLSVDRAGLTYLDAQLVGPHELALALAALARAHPDRRVLLRGDRDARHGDVLRVLDLVRAAGLHQVAFETRAPEQ
jgi:biopolymer transport protein ExbD